MALARSEQASLPQRELPAPHLFTVDDYYRLGEMGVLTEESRVELIDGVIFDMPPIGPGHASSVERICDLLRSLLGGLVHVRCQNPVRLGPRSEPEPDVAVVPRRDDYYRSGHPTPADVLLLIEVADSTLTHDRETKVLLYARADIAEYWIVNLVNGEIIVHREPARTRYRSVQLFRRGDEIRPLAFPDVLIAVSDILAE